MLRINDLLPHGNKSQLHISSCSYLCNNTTASLTHRNKGMNLVLVIFGIILAVLALAIGLGVGLTRNKEDQVPESYATIEIENFSKIKGITPTLSGFSAGGYMTCLMHTIHSNTFKGAGPIAGGPYASPYNYRYFNIEYFIFQKNFKNISFLCRKTFDPPLRFCGCCKSYWSCAGCKS